MSRGVDGGFVWSWNATTSIVHDVNSRYIWLSATALLLPLCALALGCSSGSKRRRMKAPERTMSFSSSFMSMGSWPADVKMSDPVITAFLYLGNVPSDSALRETCVKILRYDNFRSVPRRCPRRWFPPSFGTRFEWVELEVQPEDLISRVKVNGTKAVYQEMDREKDIALETFNEDGRPMPLWSLRVIENANKDEETRCVVSLRVHHSIGDGMSLVVVARDVLACTSGEKIDLGRGGLAEALAAGRKARRATSGIFSNYGIKQTLRGMKDVTQLLLGMSDTALPFGHFEGPVSGGGYPAGQSRNGENRGGCGGKRAAFSGRRCFVPFPDVSLSLIKKIKTSAGVSVNDVVMSLVSGCIRRYCDENGGEDVSKREDLQARALIPVALPRKMDHDDHKDALCNKWAFVSMDLAIGASSPRSRLESIKATTMALKNSPAAILQLLIQSYLMPSLPLEICREMVHRALATHTTTVSNVPGPNQPMDFAGQRLKRVHFAFPNIMPQVGVVSIDGVVFTNFVVDPVAVPHSETLPDHFLAELKGLLDAYNIDGSAEVSVAVEDAAKRKRLLWSDREASGRPI